MPTGTGGPRKWLRVIVHADMDAFYAAVEQRDRPELRGRPVVVGGLGGRGVVSTASYEARPFGVHSAMPIGKARRLCPHAIFLPPDFKRYGEASDRVMEVFARFSPLVEPLSLDEAFLDMTGAEGLFGPPEAMARRLKAEVREATSGLTVSVGVAPTKFVAKVASDHRKPDGLTVVEPDQVLSFLHPLPVARLWGAGPKTQAELAKLGLETIGDVARADRSWLVKRLGAFGEHIHRLSLGQDDRPVETEREAKSVGAEYTLEEDIVGEAAIRPHLRRSAGRVARRMRKEGLLASGLRVKLKTAGFRLLTRQCRLPSPTDSERALETAALELLGQFDLEVPMRLVGLAAFDLSAGGAGTQAALFEEDGREKRRTAEKTVDLLRERFGKGAVRWADDGE